MSTNKLEYDKLVSMVKKQDFKFLLLLQSIVITEMCERVTNNDVDIVEEKK